jgi:iron-sulfur cluster insertion protein
VITLTSKAAQELHAAQREKGIVGYGLKVQLVGGGCEGFLYDLLFVEEPDPNDAVFETQGLRLFVDPRSLPALSGLKIDHRETRSGTGLVFENPSARTRCSCGASFSR